MKPKGKIGDSLSQSPIEIKIIGILNQPFFCMFRLFKRDGDWERKHEKEAAVNHFNASHWSNNQNVCHNIHRRRFSKRVVIGKEESIERQYYKRNH
jgi:hypothetical protein